MTRASFIEWMERIINVVILIGAIGVFVGGIVRMFGSSDGFCRYSAGVFQLGRRGHLPDSGGCIVYLGLGIDKNTHRTAEAVEELTRR